ncbi:MAG: superoxide dismutase [Deltaproteobacteria bacterium]|nr:MAG: superoxide dismutase [Deltaproteobacteria bacterium]
MRKTSRTLTPRGRSRRTFLAASGSAGLALAAGCGGAPRPEVSTVSHADHSVVPDAYTLPELRYAFDALEPHIDALTMEIHWGRHHQAYVNGLNAALDEEPSLRERPLELMLADLDAVPESVRTAVRNHGGGHYNHTLFWDTIGPDGGGTPDGPLASAIDDAFGSFDDFRERFRDTALGVFGSGWAWLCQNEDGTLVLHDTPNQDTPLADRLHPLLGIDVWEHAYYLAFRNERGRYIDHFFEVVEWDAVRARMRGLTDEAETARAR